MGLTPEVVNHHEASTKHEFAQCLDLRWRKIRTTIGRTYGHSLPIHVEKYILKQLRIGKLNKLVISWIRIDIGIALYAAQKILIGIGIVCIPPSTATTHAVTTSGSARVICVLAAYPLKVGYLFAIDSRILIIAKIEYLSNCSRLSKQ